MAQKLKSSYKKEKILDGEVSKKILPILRKIVTTKEGTASLANVAGYEIGGKTGTAQVFGLDPEEKYIADNIDEKLRDHALFTGYAPIENPRVAIAIIVENAGSGSSKAAPLARALLDEYFIKNPVDSEKL